MQVQSDHMAEASPGHISLGLTFPTYSLCFGNGIFPVSADQSRSGKTYDHCSVIPSEADCEVAYTLAFRAASIPFESRDSRLARA